MRLIIGPCLLPGEYAACNARPVARRLLTTNSPRPKGGVFPYYYGRRRYIVMPFSHENTGNVRKVSEYLG